MKVTLWGTRGSLPTPGSRTTRYGGNTSCVEVRTSPRSTIVLDAGTGIRDLGAALDRDLERVDILLTHLHMDHIIGLGFFEPLFRPGLEVHLWGPASAISDLRGRLSRYLSPPLFPVGLRDIPSRLTLHDLPIGTFEVPGAEVTSDLVCHPGPTLGLRLTDGRRSLAYMPDHEPALGVPDFPSAARWTSGYALAADVDLLVHDAQYFDDEYPRHVGWGHSAVSHAVAFAELARARMLVAFHHDPGHDDEALDRAYSDIPADRVVPARERETFDLLAV
ncbi:MAG TPA: MBL fold metallo-hydrolase [Actinomycetota bacterium]|nr:MBL fold metallo-hydrolase [Actinomycetota bacterium]